VAKGVPFVKTKLKELMSGDMIEKNFKVGQDIKEVALKERRLEFLYPEGREFVFLDIDHLDTFTVGRDVIGDKSNFLKEGIQLKAMFYGDTIFSVELPQFLELMVIKTESPNSKVSVSGPSKIATVETGAQLEVPLFIETGDIIKVDTHSKEYIQRI
jgi:elongation factor P